MATAINTNAAEIAQEMQQEGRRWARLALDIVTEGAQVTQHAMQEGITNTLPGFPGPLNNTGDLLGSISVDVGLSASIARATITPEAHHAPVMEHGRKAGKYIPIQPLILWAKRKFTVAVEEAKSIAFAVSAHAKKHGIRGRKFVARAQMLAEKMLPKIAERHLREFADRFNRE